MAETKKCERMKVMLSDEKEGRANAKDGKTREEMRTWVSTYCGDCERELGGARFRGRGLA